MIKPALRSNASALCFILVLTIALVCPVLLSWVGLPSRTEAYKSITTSAGTVGGVIQAIDQSHADGDVVLLGSSVLTAGVSQKALQEAFANHLGRNSSIPVLAMNWPGLDVQYFMLRDYLNTHRAHVLVWNLPEPHERAYDYPHIQAYRWVRFGEYADALEGLPFNYRIALYGEMVIGAPRQLLSLVRPNLSHNEGLHVDPALQRTGYRGSPFVLENASVSQAPGLARILPLTSSRLSVRGPEPGPYQMHFARLIVQMAHDHGCRVVLLHIPTDTEFGETSIPELADWASQFETNVSIIGVPSSDLFHGMDRSRFEHFYRDAHLNENGNRLFTASVLPAIQQAYDESIVNLK